MSLNNISEDQLLEILGSYDDLKVTDHLYAFGSMLITEIGQRADRIEAKANLVIGWSTAVLAFLFTQLDKLKGSGVALQIVAVLVALAAGIALTCAYRAHRTRDDWQWPSDKDWFRESELKGDERIKKFHLQCLHTVRQTHLTITQEKGRWLVWGQRFVVTAVALLAGGIIMKVIFSLLGLRF